MYKKDSDIPKDPTVQLIKKLEKGIENVFTSDNFKNYLRTMSKFHNYSANNIVLIFLQKPEASYVAGYKTWQSLGRQVLSKKEVGPGIKIIAGCTYNLKDENGKEKIDPDTGEKEKGKYYKAVTIFDISQTKGDPLPGYDLVGELAGQLDNEKYIDHIKTLRAISKYPIIFDELKGYPKDCKGYFSRNDRDIHIRDEMSREQSIKTLIHEITHSRLHDYGADPTRDRRLKELEAEGTAFCVADHLGIDTSDYSFGYIAEWTKDIKPEDRKESLEIIRGTYQEIITDIEKYKEKENCFEKENMGENENEFDY